MRSEHHHTFGVNMFDASVKCMYVCVCDCVDVWMCIVCFVSQILVDGQTISDRRVFVRRTLYTMRYGMPPLWFGGRSSVGDLYS